MIIHELTPEELGKLLRDNLYKDLSIEPIDNYALVSSHESSIFARVETLPTDLIVLTKDVYDSILSNAASFEYTPMFIAEVPTGIFAFNLEMMKLNFEPYTHEEQGDILVTELPLSRGTQILEWYPDFNSEEEYVDALMSGTSQWED